jgi:hypothetical protein
VCFIREGILAGLSYSSATLSNYQHNAQVYDAWTYSLGGFPMEFHLE